MSPNMRRPRTSRLVSPWQKGEGRVNEFADDGIGFDPEAVKGRGGLGLDRHARNAARLVKGKLSIAASPGRGTRIALNVPFA